MRVLEHTGDRTDDGDLKPIENPGNATRNDNKPVPPALGKTVHPGGNIGPDRLHVGPYVTTHSAHSVAPLQPLLLLWLFVTASSFFEAVGPIPPRTHLTRTRHNLPIDRCILFSKCDNSCSITLYSYIVHVISHVPVSRSKEERHNLHRWN